MRRLFCVALFCACGSTPSEIVGHYDTTCNGVAEGGFEITADHQVILPLSDGSITEQHVTEDGDAWQVDVTSRQMPGEGGFIAERRQLKLDHEGGTGTITTSSTGQPTPTITCASLVATRTTAP